MASGSREGRDGDIVIHRINANADADARSAAEEIIEESGHHTLDGITIRELLDEGRRG
jgi:hypothetical protein